MQQRLLREDYIGNVVEKYSDMLIRISFTYMNNVSDAEDIAQEVFIKLIEKKPAFENVEHEKAWLIRVTINSCKNRLKTAWFRKTRPLSEGDNAYNFTHKETEVLDVVLNLPLKYRSIIYLFYYESYSINEIAEILKISQSTIGSQLHRARKLLKSRLEVAFDYD